MDRYRTIALLALLIVVQLLLIAWQVRRPGNGGVRLLRVWSIEAIVPVEKASQWVFGGVRSFFTTYLTLHEAEQENQQLHQRIDQLRIVNQQLREQVRSLPRLDALLGFQQNYINHTRAAQVIGSGTTTDAQVIYLNRGRNDGLRRNMAVISPEGIVGKVTQVFGGTSEVLLITDPDSGVGVMLANSGVHGVLQGLGTNRAQLKLVIDDQTVTPGEEVLTSGEDQVYPRGLPVGTVVSARPGSMFQQIIVKPAAQLSSLNSVLVVTTMGHSLPLAGPDENLTAAQIRQKQLPTIPSTSVVPQTGPPPPMAVILAERRRAAIAAAQAANARQQGLPVPGTSPAAAPAPGNSATGANPPGTAAAKPVPKTAVGPVAKPPRTPLAKPSAPAPGTPN